MQSFRQILVPALMFALPFVMIACSQMSHPENSAASSTNLPKNESTFGKLFGNMASYTVAVYETQNIAILYRESKGVWPPNADILWKYAVTVGGASYANQFENLEFHPIEGGCVMKYTLLPGSSGIKVSGNDTIMLK